MESVASVVLGSAARCRSEQSGGFATIYAYEMTVTLATGRVVEVWRRYAEVDDLRQTIVAINGGDVDDLPKLSQKSNFLSRKSRVENSAVHQRRIVELQEFFTGMLEFLHKNSLLLPVKEALNRALALFFTPNEQDRSRSLTADRLDSTAAVAQARALMDFKGENDTFLTLQEEEECDVIKIDEEKKCYLCSYDSVDDDDVHVTHVGLVPFDVVTIVQFYPTITPHQRAWFQASAPKPKNALEELISSEEKYVESLREVQQSFFPKIRALVNAAEAAALFQNWTEIISVSQDLLAAFSVEGVDLVEVLADALPKLGSAYSRYCAGIPNAQQMYERKIKTKAFKYFEKSFETLNKPTLNYIMRPVQRIMKYPLLLSEIKKSFKEDPAALERIESALSAATQLAFVANTHMNDQPRTLETFDISQPEHFEHVLSFSSSSTSLSTMSPETALSIIHVDTIPPWEIYAAELKLPVHPDLTFMSYKEGINGKLFVFTDDISSLKVDALVTFAHPTLNGSGGVEDSTIRRAAGPMMTALCEAIDDACGVGEAIISPGFMLPARFVIHTVPPAKEDPVLLMNCFSNVLDIARKNFLRTIAIPALGNSISEFPRFRAAWIALQSIRLWLDKKENFDAVDRVVVCVCNPTELSLYHKYIPSFFPASP